MREEDLDFHKRTEYTRQRLFFTPRTAQRGPMPPIYKEYNVEKIKLPKDFEPKGLLLEEAIQKRRSIRDYSGEPISLEELSRLLYHAGGITATEQAYSMKEFPLKAAPSAGALNPIEIYPVISLVEGIEMGLYHYNPKEHALEILKQSDFRKKIAEVCLDQEFLAEANVVFVLSAVYARTKWKYGQRAYRYVHLDAGHVAENLQLEAVSLGLATCAVGAFLDDEINKFLELDGEDEFVVLNVAVGKPMKQL